MNIRTMQEDDLDFAAGRTAAEGWAGETRDVLAGLLAASPRGCFIVEEDGRRVGMGTTAFYGNAGFVGELIVLEECRGSGIGAAMVDYAVDHLRQRGAGSIFLDGVHRAVSLYERCGFRKVCRSLRFSGKEKILAEGASEDTLRKLKAPPGTGVRIMQPQDFETVGRMDVCAFGADRGASLRQRLDLYPDLCLVNESGGTISGFLFGKQGMDLVTAGPIVVFDRVERDFPDTAFDADDPAASAASAEVRDDPLPAMEIASVARSLLLELVRRASGVKVSLGVLESNSNAVSMIRSLGFTEQKNPPWRMVLGPDHHLAMSPACYAIGSPAKG